LNTDFIDKDTLKDIFETMGQVIIEEEFEQQFRDIDTDGVSELTNLILCWVGWTNYF